MEMHLITVLCEECEKPIAYKLINGTNRNWSFRDVWHDGLCSYCVESQLKLYDRLGFPWAKEMLRRVTCTDKFNAAVRRSADWLRNVTFNLMR